MQDDGKKAVEDDLIDDDMDFGDFDDDFEDDLDVDLGGDADLAVDDWDDVDADESLDVDPSSFGDAPPKDSFLKKNFNFIVIAIAVLGGGGFVLTQMSGAPVSSPAVPAEQSVDNEAVVEVDMGEMPPAPASVDVGAPEIELSALPSDDAANLTEVADDSALTPLPTLDGQELDLVPLDFLSDDTADGSVVVDEIVSALPAETLIEEPVQEAPAESFVADLELVVDDPLVDLPVEEDIVPDVELSEDLTSLPVFEQLEEKDALVATLRKDNEAKDVAIADANAQVSLLENTVNDLKAELEAVRVSLDEARAAEKRAVESAQVVAVPAPSVDAVEDMPVKAVLAPPAKKPVVQVEANKIPAVSYQWVLRAAQPGKAMIFNGNTQDVLNVETGDVVPGIGVVKSISIQNNLWVVEGQEGRITQ
jgi:hypothetical protein